MDGRGEQRGGERALREFAPYEFRHETGHRHPPRDRLFNGR
jgi:hypothetical protein